MERLESVQFLSLGCSFPQPGLMLQSLGLFLFRRRCRQFMLLCHRPLELVFYAIVILTQTQNLRAEFTMKESIQCLNTVLNPKGIHQGMAEGKWGRWRRMRHCISIAQYHLCFHNFIFI
jgi:hypothetical protein